MSKRKFKRFFKRFHDGVGGAALNIKVVPRASRDEISGIRPDGALKVRVTAPPVGGEANKAVVKLLAKELGVSARKIEIVAGETSTLKLVSIVGLTADEVNQRLGLKAAATSQNGE